MDTPCRARTVGRVASRGHGGRPGPLDKSCARRHRTIGRPHGHQTSSLLCIIPCFALSKSHGDGDVQSRVKSCLIQTETLPTSPRYPNMHRVLRRGNLTEQSEMPLFRRWWRVREEPTRHRFPIEGAACQEQRQAAKFSEEFRQVLVNEGCCSNEFARKKPLAFSCLRTCGKSSRKPIRSARSNTPSVPESGIFLLSAIVHPICSSTKRTSARKVSARRMASRSPRCNVTGDSVV